MDPGSRKASLRKALLVRDDAVGPVGVGRKSEAYSANASYVAGIVGGLRFAYPPYFDFGSVMRLFGGERSGTSTTCSRTEVGLPSACEIASVRLSINSFEKRFIGAGYRLSCTYSKSPGLLSMPALGGAIQGANTPGSVTGRIRLWI
jgi:hypothetical protein